MTTQPERFLISTLNTSTVFDQHKTISELYYLFLIHIYWNRGHHPNLK